MTPCGHTVLLVMLVMVIAQLVTSFSVARAVTRSLGKIRAVYATPEGSSEAAYEADEMVTTIEQMVRMYTDGSLRFANFNISELSLN